jgi:uncharacterized OB-fold protein
VAAAYVPQPTPVTAPFWDAAKNGELHIQWCRPCERFYFYPRSFCPHCHSREVEWRPVSGRARLLSYVILQRPAPGLWEEVPTVIALVELEEGPHMLSNIVEIEPERASIPLDLPLVVTFVDRGEVSLPVFRPAEPPAG